MSPAFLRAGMLTGLILYRSCAGSCSSCELRTAPVLLCLGDSFAQVFLNFWILQSCPLLDHSSLGLSGLTCIHMCIAWINISKLLILLAMITTNKICSFCIFVIVSGISAPLRIEPGEFMHAGQTNTIELYTVPALCFHFFRCYRNTTKVQVTAP